MTLTADDVYDVQFALAAIGTRGYSVADVDTFLIRVAATLRGEDTVTPEEVHSVSFGRPALGKRGYDQAEVDVFLQLVESTLAGRAETATERFHIAPALEHSHTRKPLWRRKVRG
ncbi:DivIVA domain-containing protein [Amycolatopsis anabasis]|uniref:DivIVA domain-containing protein n=1 Tax=Amycolatopsis anabasis TaxID=1840409 RepID=UPI00131DCABF|nr:DivIVA domain-containing protein [Amycolatopsis anabasis]